MTLPKPTIVFFGTDDFSVPTLQALIDAGYPIMAVVTKPDAPTGRSRTLVAPAVKFVAQDHHIPVLQPTSVSAVASELSSLQPSLGVVVAYGKIIPQSVIDLFPLGVLNIHTSLLPRYRGAAPIEAAIHNGDSETGVTLMQIDAGMDTGPIYAQSKLKLRGDETRPELYEALSKLGATFLLQSLPSIIDGSLQPQPQDEKHAVVVGMIQKADGLVDWRLPATDIERQVRAHLGWPGSRTVIDGIDVIITAVSVGSSEPFMDSSDAGTLPGTFFKTVGNQLAVTTGHGELIINRLKPAGKREMTGREFLAGHPL